jgi:hypothetical protein
MLDSYRENKCIPVQSCPFPYLKSFILVLWWSIVSLSVAVHLWGLLLLSFRRFHTFMTPIVSPVYKTAAPSDSTCPSRHSTGRVWDEMDPRLCSGSGLSGWDKSLKDRLLALPRENSEILELMSLPEPHYFVRAPWNEKLKWWKDMKCLHKIRVSIRRHWDCLAGLENGSCSSCRSFHF